MEYESAHGVHVPKLGLGTARMTGKKCREVVSTGLDLGYRHIDTAQMYDNEEAVGDALDGSNVAREEVFLTTKLNRGNVGYDAVFESFDASLRRLGTDYVDLLLIHTPSRSVPVEETLEAMNQLYDEGTVGHIGVSNFSVDKLQEAMSVSTAPILTNQVKYHPYHGQPDLLEFCLETECILTAYSPLARGKVADDATLSTIGDRYGKTAAQVALRWLLQQEGVVTIPKAATHEHLEENLEVFDFALSDEEMTEVFEEQGGLVERLRSRLRL